MPTSCLCETGTQVQTLLGKLQAVFELPRRLHAAIDNGALEIAVGTYADAEPLLRRYGHKVCCASDHLDRHHTVLYDGTICYDVLKSARTPAPGTPVLAFAASHSVLKLPLGKQQPCGVAVKHADLRPDRVTGTAIALCRKTCSECRRYIFTWPAYMCNAAPVY